MTPAATACYCHVDGHKHQKRERERYRMTTKSYHEHRCECTCGCNHDTLGYAFCPFCHFEHAKLRRTLPDGEFTRPKWWTPGRVGA